MVKGLDTFRNHFAGYEEQYVLIGGAACDIVFESNDASLGRQEILIWFLSLRLSRLNLEKSFGSLLRSADTETRPRMVKSRSFTDLINLKMTHIRNDRTFLQE